MNVTINQFRTILEDSNSEPLPIGGAHVADETMTAAGTSVAMAAGTIMVRIATDTAINGDFWGSGSEAFLPANSVEYFPAVAGQTFTITTVA